MSNTTSQHTTIDTLQPHEVWKHFIAINAIPRASKKEERIIAYIKDFGESLNLETIVDQVGNVIIKKPTSTSNSTPSLILQGHLDMVHQKNNDSDFDFDHSGIDMYITDGWVRARGTTLGADNGLGVAAIMAILESKTIKHPAIEALFTIDEETGMTGAKGLSKNILTGTTLLNFDTEDDEEIGIGCAGGIDITATRKYDIHPINQKSHQAIQISISGLKGGHSGMDIHLGLANANKLLIRAIMKAAQKYKVSLSSIAGGSLRNAIPREAMAIFYIPIEDLSDVECLLEQSIFEIKQEYNPLEPTINFTFSSIDADLKVINATESLKLIYVLNGIHNGVFRYSPSLPCLVETSNNLAKITLSEGTAEILCLTRSSIESSRTALVDCITSVLSLGSFDIATSGDYPGWTPNPDSAILKVIKDTYVKTFNHEPKVGACHAGLECGIISSKYPNVDMVSYGPTILGAHSPDERVNIDSVNKFWQLTLILLERLS